MSEGLAWFPNDALHRGGRLFAGVMQLCNARAALKLADRGYVLDAGELVLEGEAAALEQDPKVLESYLGLQAESAA